MGKKDKEISEMSAKIVELLACMPSTGSTGGQARVSASPVTSLANYSANGASSLSLDLPAATDLSSFNTGKLTGLGLSNLEEKLGSLFSGAPGYTKANGNSNLE